jgi:hypothetical protein
VGEDVLCGGEVGFVAAGGPDEELALAFVGSDAMHAQEVDDVLRLDAIGLPSVDLSEDFLVVEVA